MAIEDQKYDALLKALHDYMGTGRTAMVRSALVKLAISILKHYGYDVVETPPVGDIPAG